MVDFRSIIFIFFFFNIQGSRDNMSIVLVCFSNAPKVSDEAMRKDSELDKYLESRVEGKKDAFFFKFRRKAKVLFLVCQIILLKFPIDFGLKIHYSGMREGKASLLNFNLICKLFGFESFVYICSIYYFPFFLPFWVNQYFLFKLIPAFAH